MAVLLMASIAAVELKDLFPKGAVRHGVMSWHYQTGIAILGLFFIRAIWRIKNPPPPVVPILTRMQALASSLAHAALYSMMFLMPVLGVLAKQSKGDEVVFLGYVLPVMLDEDNGLPYALTIKAVHVYLGNVFIWMIILHITATLYHHFIRRDDVLIRMISSNHCSKVNK